MEKRYPEYQQLSLTTIADDILKFWDEEKIFEKSVTEKEGKDSFVFYEGPPSANGMPGIHHVISRTLKDLVCRYKTMRGYQVNRKGGWDTHGLPVELGVEKLLGITKEDIGKKISVEEYNATCRREVLKYKDKWDELTRKMGYWVDLKHPYITFENDYIETLWWCLRQLYDKDLLYESVSIQPYSPAAGTGLSSHELNQPGTYKDVKDTSVVAMFKAVRNQDSEFLFKDSTADIYYLAWTTTPWTLPSNLGLTVGEKIDYCLIETANPYTGDFVNIVVAQPLIGQYLKPEGEGQCFDQYKAGDKIVPWKVLKTFKGKDLEGLRYEQLLPSEANTLEKVQEITPGADPFKIITGDFVTTEDGTGIVHTAPAFGADDFKVGKSHNLGILTLVDKEGKFIDGVGEFSGRYVKDYKDEKDYVDVNVDIAVKLKLEGRAFRIEKYEHNYPHCWRTDKPVIYYPLEAWFIRTTAAKDRMIELNKTINWKPASTGTGRFGNWLENMVDWNLSRSRFWGTPLPVWRTEDGEEEICIGSKEELIVEIGKSIDKGFVALANRETKEAYILRMTKDLHKPYVDDIVLVSPNGKPMKRVPDLIDVWFDSGAMPYAQWHFPFENKETFKKNFPADFIAEGVDQTRGWFYTLHVLGALLFDSVAYKTVVSNGLVLDKNGNKMSKRLGNAVDPFVTLAELGPDATRWYLITNASPWDSLRFDVEGIKEVQRKLFGTLYNTYQFFALYANVDDFHNQHAEIPVSERPEMDRWILSSLNSLVDEVVKSFDDYEPTVAGRAIDTFVNDELSNWYVRLCRRRFWKPARTENGVVNAEDVKDKISAYQTLLECLVTVSKLMAPVAPFFADWLYKNLMDGTGAAQKPSVHLTDFPVANGLVIDKELEERMALAQDISSLILSLRKKVNIKVRQPLQKVIIPSLGADFERRLQSGIQIIKSETNIKEVELLPVDNDFIKKRAKANFKTLGKRLGARMKWAANEIQQLTNDKIDEAVNGQLLLNPDYEKAGEDPIYITGEDLELSTNEIPGYEVAIKGPLTVALDLELSDALKNEGYSRELVNRVQNLRKVHKLEITDKIVLIVEQKNGVKDIISGFNEYICAEILARQIDFVPELKDGEKIEVNDDILTVKIIKI
ncbi:MAG: isoleucine--tRNA ligase [Chitinophagaceae bacterium]|nr:isoleucine--tRNA ligase [Chitinophagaceae bacterium]